MHLGSLGPILERQLEHTYIATCFHNPINLLLAQHQISDTHSADSAHRFWGLLRPHPTVMKIWY